mgnify:CR=1 FL=1
MHITPLYRNAEAVAAKKASLGWNIGPGEKEVIPEDVYFKVVYPEGVYIFECKTKKEKQVFVVAKFHN